MRATAEKTAPKRKLTVGPAGDRYEQEADRISRGIVRGSAAPRVQRSCACGGSCPRCEAAPPIVHDVLSSPGAPLDTKSRGLMESHLGEDLGNVRVHTDPIAAESAKALGANAYTVGNHIAFGANRYQPTTPAGTRRRCNSSISLKPLHDLVAPLTTASSAS